MRPHLKELVILLIRDIQVKENDGKPKLNLKNSNIKFEKCSFQYDLIKIKQLEILI